MCTTWRSGLWTNIVINIFFCVQDGVLRTVSVLGTWSQHQGASELGDGADRCTSGTLHDRQFHWRFTMAINVIIVNSENMLLIN